jgi:transposase-like protein
MQKRRKYSEEFKREAVSFANQPGVTARQVAEPFLARSVQILSQLPGKSEEP